MSQKNFIFRTSLSFLKKSFLNPASSPSDGRILVRFLFKPVIYDLYALCVQLLDYRRMLRLPLPEQDDQSEAAVAIRHNLLEIQSKSITTTRRVEVGYQVATTPWRPLKNEKILIIGCRNAMELHQARLAGFSWNNISGLDLFSTNKKILTMNMEDMSAIDDSSYDVVIMMYTLGYSTKPKVVFSEVLRILKPGGRFVFTYGRHMEDVTITSEFSGDTMTKAKFSPAIDFVDFLQGHGAQLYFHDVSDRMVSSGIIQATHLFGFIKSEPSVDPIWKVNINAIDSGV